MLQNMGLGSGLVFSLAWRLAQTYNLSLPYIIILCIAYCILYSIIFQLLYRILEITISISNCLYCTYLVLEDIKAVVYGIRNMAVLNKEAHIFHLQILVKFSLRLQTTRVRKMSSGKVYNIWGLNCKREMFGNYSVWITTQTTKSCTSLYDWNLQCLPVQCIWNPE